ncbi:hypothetical protein ACVDG5_028240 [Mesorhizobium sp. ORM6]
MPGLAELAGNGEADAVHRSRTGDQGASDVAGGCGHAGSFGLASFSIGLVCRFTGAPAIRCNENVGAGERNPNDARVYPGANRSAPSRQGRHFLTWRGHATTGRRLATLSSMNSGKLHKIKLMDSSMDSGKGQSAALLPRAEMGDSFGYIAFGNDELYARGALFSALRLLHYCPDAKIAVLTDRPHVFDGYPIRTMELTAGRMSEMSFGDRYRFGIKAAGVIDLLEHCERLFFMDTDMYPIGDISGCFGRISASHSIMRKSEGKPKPPYRAIEDKGFLLGGCKLTGYEPMWSSGVLGVHNSNIPALRKAYSAIEQMVGVVKAHTPEQFCIGVALSQDGRSISRHRLPIRNYTTRGKKLFARRRLEAFFAANGHLCVSQQVEQAATCRLWRAPIDLWKQRDIWHF